MTTTFNIGDFVSFEVVGKITAAHIYGETEDERHEQYEADWYVKHDNEDPNVSIDINGRKFPGYHIKKLEDMNE